MRQTRWRIQSLILLCAAVFLTGCGPTQVIYLREEDPVRLRQDVKNVKIWARDAKGEWVPSTTTLRNGSFNLTDPQAPEFKEQP